MTPIALTDRQMHEVRQAAQLVPFDLRPLYLERLAAALQGKDVGDGLAHRVAYQIAVRSCGIPDGWR
jgi:hypothetical protein